VEGPSKADMECNQESDGICRVRYKPTEPGNYIVNVKFADEHIQGKTYTAIFKFQIVLEPCQLCWNHVNCTRIMSVMLEPCQLF